MGTLLFTLLFAAEILLAVLTCTKWREKQRWYKNRLLFTAGEFLLLLITLLCPIGNKWRLYGCFALVILRLVLAGLTYLIKHKKATGEKSRVGTIIGAIFCTILMGISLIPTALFSGYAGIPTTGNYAVKTSEAILVDDDRLEAKETDGSHREVPIHFYYPDGNAKDCPFVLFAHGSFGYYQSNDSLYRELASNGYVVASIDHPYYAFFTTDTDGKTIIVDLNFMQTAVDMENNQMSDEDAFPIIQEWLNLRAADENFVLDSIKAAKDANTLSDTWHTEQGSEILDVLRMTDTSKIGLTGHSIGGAVAVKLGRERDDITAVIDIDGTMSSERTDIVDGKFVYNDTPYPTPVLALDNETHGTYYVNSPAKDQDYVNKYLMDNAVDGREMSFEDTLHLDFTDLPLFAPGLVKMMGMGQADARTFIPELNSIVLNYFNYYLKGEGTLTVKPWNN